MTTIEYLSLSKPRRFLVKFLGFFTGIFFAIVNFFRYLPKNIWHLLKKCANPLFVLKDAFKNGNWFVRTNFLICGFTQLFSRQVIKGVLYLLYEGVFLYFLIAVGIPAFAKLGNLGTIAATARPVIDSISGEAIQTAIYNDNSFQILLNSVFTIALMIIFVVLWYFSIRDAKSLHDNELIGRYAANKDFFKRLGSDNYHIVLLSIPMVGLLVFTIIPIVFMVIIGFTNYDSNHLPPDKLFDWVGWAKYAQLFSSSASSGGTLFLTTFLQVLAWTLIWAFFATFTNYFLGMIVALMINRKGIKFKKLWRTILITTIAVPQFVSLLLLSRMLNTEVGFFNNLLKSWGWISKNIEWLNDPIITKVVIIVINMWIGIPYTMLVCTGILMNIPGDLYESAKIDGASPFKMYMKITLPYMLFVTGPYLISTFVGNINNFNVIYLLSQGNPLFTFGAQSVPSSLTGLGQTDLLITWIYKICMTNTFKDYGTASVLGVMIFAIVAFFSLILYGKTSSVKNEGDFQ